ncbi:DUF481 domain-containing protein [Halioxenophilus aromaticivorans]|uniref:DUF481 domain-containing protein n=1 Tax=Halioxenophilus aromaticivorans TaxID=1306992 RepID=A0AAV3TZP4_9ALTE
MNKTKIATALALVITSSSSLAAEWKGTGEAGLVLVEGNSESKVANGAVNFDYVDGAPWEHSAGISGTSAEADGVKSAESYTAKWLSKYLLSERTFVFGDLRFFDDKFDSYEAIYTASVGAGYKVIVQENITWDISAGFGYRKTKEEETGDNQSGINYLLTSAYAHKLTDTTSIENDTRIEISSDNTFTNNIFGLRVAINTDLALKVAYEWRNNSDTAPGIEDTDTITSVNLVYSF